MRGAPRVESASRSERSEAGLPRAGRIRLGLARSQRLRTPEQFAALAGDRAQWRHALKWIAVAARAQMAAAASTSVAGPDDTGAASRSPSATLACDAVPADSHEAAPPRESRDLVAVRFGFTVGRRQARRAVQRVMVKRIMREAVRAAAPALAQGARGRQVEVVLRLRSALPDPAAMTWGLVKRALRAEADLLMARLGTWLGSAQR
jgi:ribonuclease P protein component